ncbi:MAG TPA: mechanosensitive ion channel family protein [Bacteroidetes bacterium]|nr:mechanosensitive ion channel family protein [Bacteroidota bacterium]
MKKLQLKVSLFSFLFLLLGAAGISQANQAPVPTLESPYNTMLVHLYYLQPDSYEPEIAAKAFNVEDSVQAIRLAIQLKQVLDGRGLFVHLNLLPQQNDYLDSLTQQPFYTPFPKELPEVYLEKTDSLWHYSQQTANAIPRLHRELYPFGTDLLVGLFPDSGQRKFIGLAAWQWAGTGLLLLLAWLLQILMSRLFRPMVRLLAKSRYSSPIEDKTMLWKVAQLASFTILLWLLKSALPLLQLPVRANVFLINGLEMAIVAVGVWLALSIIDVVMQYAFRYASTTEQKMDEQLIPIMRRMLKIVVVVGGTIYILQLLDVNVTALIAGVSIGGLALALAAQDTVRNLIGSAMIFFDKPFQIGDWVVAGSNEGEVIEVGFRSTKIQAVDSSIITVPNSQVSSAAVKNMGVRRLRLMKATLGVTYDTPPVLLEKFIAGLRQLIEKHPKTKKDNYLVHFNSFGDSALQIYFRTHLLTTSFAEELELKEELAFGILQLAEALGVRFAFPSQTLFIEEMPGKASLAPAYETDEEVLEEKLERFFSGKKEAH